MGQAHEVEGIATEGGRKTALVVGGSVAVALVAFAIVVGRGGDEPPPARAPRLASPRTSTPSSAGETATPAAATPTTKPSSSTTTSSTPSRTTSSTPTRT